MVMKTHFKVSEEHLQPNWTRTQNVVNLQINNSAVPSPGPLGVSFSGFSCGKKFQSTPSLRADRRLSSETDWPVELPGLKDRRELKVRCITGKPRTFEVADNKIKAKKCRIEGGPKVSPEVLLQTRQWTRT